MSNKYRLEDLLTLMSRLREPEYGCPWDLKQSYKTIAASTLEEAYEVVDAIEQENFADLKEELGDLLFQIVFYSQLGEEDSHFDFYDIVDSITEKLIRRHPHVFPDGTLESRIDINNKAQEDKNIQQNWEAIKQQERNKKGYQSVLDDVPISLPSIARAAKLQKRASTVGFDWDNIEDVYHKITEEIEEVKQAAKTSNKEELELEIGDLLFSVVNLARHYRIDPESALRKANRKFTSRFQHMEQRSHQLNLKFDEQSASTLDAWWEEAKTHTSA